MNYKFVNDVDRSQMRLTISLPWRSRVHHERKKVKWVDVRRLVEENYTPPETHTLGECVEKYKIIDNNYPDALEATWEFELLPKKRKRASKCELEKKTTTAVNKTSNTRTPRKKSRKSVARKK
jgi:hypothetical protein